jgi:hypothetical protein
MDEVDERFYARADEHINLSNDQLSQTSRGKVSASMLYSVARFNAWLTACNCRSGNEMRTAKQEAIEYFAEQYKKMLVENLEDYIDNFDRYMSPK